MSDIPESRIELKVYRVNGFCPECSKNHNELCCIEKTGIVFMANPCRFEYICTNCKNKFLSTESYPRIEHKDMSGE